VARDLEDLAQLLRADLNKGKPHVLEERNETKTVSHVCSWTILFKGESVTETGTGTKKKFAERTAAAKLLRWLEKRDPVRDP
jgi:dsRNA-specific ribonuclease